MPTSPFAARCTQRRAESFAWRLNPRPPPCTMNFRHLGFIDMPIDEEHGANGDRIHRPKHRNELRRSWLCAGQPAPPDHRRIQALRRREWRISSWACGPAPELAATDMVPQPLVDISMWPMFACQTRRLKAMENMPANAYLIAVHAVFLRHGRRRPGRFRTSS